MLLALRKEWFPIFLLLCISCVEPKGNDDNTEETDLVFQVASCSCEQFSRLTSGIVSYAVSEWLSDLSGEEEDVELGSLAELPLHWCNCYTYFVSEELRQKFTNEELEDIDSDNAKLHIVIEKIFELREKDIRNCIEQTENEAVEDYAGFVKKLNQKFTPEQ